MLLVGLGVAVVAGGGWVLLDGWRVEREIDALGSELRRLRTAADSCRAALAREEIAFRDYDRRVDSLRAEMSGLEALHPDGVPADTYSVYLDAFDRYNAAVPAWRMQADSLQTHWDACRERVEAHNAHADSLRKRVRETNLPGS